MMIESAVLAALWLLYFILHSSFASFRFKKWFSDRFPAAIQYFRIAYNVFAVVSLLPMLLLMLLWRGPPVIQWGGSASLVLNGLALIALVMFYHSTRFYDMSEFLGTRQAKLPVSDPIDASPLCISPYHRFVRHPWYTFGLVLIWTRNMDQLQLISSIAMTLYFIFGSRLEEQKLLAAYGERYAKYLRSVPGLIPLPWKFLRRGQVL